MKRNVLIKFFVCLFTVVALCSCDKDDDEGYIITAQVENGSNIDLDEVKAEIGYETDLSRIATEIASSEYRNGKFRLKLPATVSDKYIVELGEMPDGVTVTNPDVKGGGISIEAYKSGENTGAFYYAANTLASYCIGELLYVNRDVNITGATTVTEETYEPYEGIMYTYNWTEKYDLHLKTGWNWIYLKETDKGNAGEVEATTQAPSGLKWYYESYSSGEYQSISGKKAPSLFSKSKIRF
jgi:hypothetical protein